MTLLCVCHCPRHTPQPLDTPLPSAEGPPLAKAPRTLAPPLCEPVTRVPSVRAGLCKPGSKPGSEEAGTRGSRAASAPLVEPRGGRRPPSGAPPREASVARGELTPFFFCVYVYVCVWFFFLAFSVSNSCASEGWWLFQPRALRWVCAVGHGRSVQAANAMAMAPTRTPGAPGCLGAPTPRQSQPRCCSGVTLVLHPSLLLAGCPAEHALGSPGRWPGSATEAETERVPLVPKAAPQPKASVQPRGWQGPRTSGWSRAPGPGLQGGSKTFPRVLERSGQGLAAQLPPLRS